MMKDDDGLSKYIDILIHRYLTQASRIRPTDIAQRPFAYISIRLSHLLIPVISLLLILQ